MNNLKIELIGFDDLSDDEKESVPNNGNGKEHANYIKVTYMGDIILLKSDAMEPEDADFGRDLKWIADSLKKCYEIGMHNFQAPVERIVRPKIWPLAMDFLDEPEVEAYIEKVEEDARLLAAWLQWCLDNRDDSAEHSFGIDATKRMRDLLAGLPASMPIK